MYGWPVHMGKIPKWIALYFKSGKLSLIKLVGDPHGDRADGNGGYVESPTNHTTI